MIAGRPTKVAAIALAGESPDRALRTSSGVRLRELLAHHRHRRARAASPQPGSSNANSLCGQNLAGFLEICAAFQRDILRRHFRVRVLPPQPASPSPTGTKADRARNAATSQYFPHLVWSSCPKTNHGSRILGPVSEGHILVSRFMQRRICRPSTDLWSRSAPLLLWLHGGPGGQQRDVEALVGPSSAKKAPLGGRESKVPAD
jgi:hypothetical protein